MFRFIFRGLLPYCLARLVFVLAFSVVVVVFAAAAAAVQQAMRCTRVFVWDRANKWRLASDFLLSCFFCFVCFAFSRSVDGPNHWFEVFFFFLLLPYLALVCSGNTLISISWQLNIVPSRVRGSLRRRDCIWMWLILFTCWLITSDNDGSGVCEAQFVCGFCGSNLCVAGRHWQCSDDWQLLIDWLAGGDNFTGIFFRWKSFESVGLHRCFQPREDWRKCQVGGLLSILVSFVKSVNSVKSVYTVKSVESVAKSQKPTGVMSIFASGMWFLLEKTSTRSIPACVVFPPRLLILKLLSTHPSARGAVCLL